MIRMLSVLAVFLFSALWFLGEDHGQVIHPPTSKPRLAALPPQVRPVFIPAQPVMQPVAPDKTAPLPSVTPQDAAPLAQGVESPPPETPVLEGRRMHTPGGATVRSGPGRGYAPLGTLTAGESVLVVDEGSTANWLRVSFGGQIGWVSARLLRE